MSRGGSRLRRALARALLLGFSIAFAVGIGEVGLRLLGHRGVAMLDMSQRIVPVDDDTVDYRYRPNSEYWTGDVVYRFNSAGFRDVEHTVAKPAAVTRVAVIGDSVTEGHGVRAESRFTSQARGLLGEGYEIIDIAMSGLNAPQVVHLLEAEGLRYEPDVVVMNFVLNDCDFYTRYKPAVEFAARKDGEIDLLGISIDPRVKRLLKSSALVYFLNRWAERALGEEDVSHGDYVLGIWGRPENRTMVAGSFDRLAALQAEHGFEVLVLIWPVIADFDDYAYREIHTWVAAQATARGMDVVDLLPAFAEREDHAAYYLSPNDYFHPNADGHRVGARVFAEWMRERSGAAPGRS